MEDQKILYYQVPFPKSTQEVFDTTMAMISNYFEKHLVSFYTNSDIVATLNPMIKKIEEIYESALIYSVNLASSNQYRYEGIPEEEYDHLVEFFKDVHSLLQNRKSNVNKKYEELQKVFEEE
jgi:hypothetical protein